MNLAKSSWAVCGAEKGGRCVWVHGQAMALTHEVINEAILKWGGEKATFLKPGLYNDI